MNKNGFIAFLVIAFTALVFYLLLVSDANGFLKFFIALVLLGGCGITIQWYLKLDGEYGLLLLRTSKGLEYIDIVANAAPRLWQACADLGTVMGFGVSSIFFFKQIPKKTFVFSLFVLIIASQLMTQKVFQVVIELINIPIDFDALSSQAAAASLMPILVFFAMIFFGFCGVTVVGLIANTYSIITNVVNVALSVPGSNLSDAVPGASPVIPGINMPLLEGLIALAVLLFVHETAHGILSRIGKIKLESAGLLLYGIIPVGAFVDPDEKMLSKKDIDVQTRVFSAGSASNLILFMLSFFLLIGFEAFTVPNLDPSVYIHSVQLNSSAFEANISEGTKIISLNQVPITWDNLDQFREIVQSSETVRLETDEGNYLLTPKSSVEGEHKSLGILLPPNRYYLPEYFWMGFIKNTLGLIFVLNFLVGVINLMPMFMAFDGYRIVSLHVKNKTLVRFISYSLLIMLLLNFAPWLWR